MAKTTTFDLIRPSTLLRLGEDTILGAVRGIGRGTKRFAHGVRVEYTAQTIARYQRRLERETQILATMSEEQRIKVALEQGEILDRVEQLRRKRR